MIDFSNEVELKLKISSNNDNSHIYDITFSADEQSCLNIKAKQNTDTILQKSKIYFKKYTLEQIKENKYFIMYEDLKEVCDELNQRIKNEEVTVTEKENKLIIIFIYPNSKVTEIEFELEEESNIINDDINDLRNMIIKLIDDNKMLKNKVDECQKEIYNFKNMIKSQKIEITNLKNEIQEIKNSSIQQNIIIDIKENALKENELIKNDFEENNMKKNDSKDNNLKENDSEENDMEENDLEENVLKDFEYVFNFQSKIIKGNKNYIDFLNKQIHFEKAKLLYRLTKNGNQITKFHQLCDNQGPTLTLILVSNGTIVGFYTPLSWDNSGWKNDNETFLFNLNKMKIYKKVDNDKSILCRHYEYGPWTFSFGFNESGQMKKLYHGGFDIDIAYSRGSSILPNERNNYKYFDVKEVEIYQIVLNYKVNNY